MKVITWQCRNCYTRNGLEAWDCYGCGEPMNGVISVQFDVDGTMDEKQKAFQEWYDGY